ncbi:MAG: hypothetical protein AB7N65_17130 [Vicinamibacterales bacterium]
MQRQLRLGDILDDYCPRERRLTNHAIVAMIGEDVKQTRCTTCDAEHEYKHARVPRQRQKDTPVALRPQTVPSGPKRVTAEAARGSDSEPQEGLEGLDESGHALPSSAEVLPADAGGVDADEASAPAQPDEGARPDEESEAGDASAGDAEGPAHRRLIRATLPRLEGQPPAPRPAPDFTIRTPATGRPNRFRARPARGGGHQPFTGNRTGSSGNPARGGQRGGGNTRSPLPSHQTRRFDGRKRSK